jgi:hypothetical protein
MIMDLRSMLNPPDNDAAAAAAAQAQAHAQSHPYSHPHSHPHSQPAPHHIKTPQRTASLAHPLPYNSHSPPPITDKVPLPRTTSLPAQVTHYRRESTASVSPKTIHMPPPAPVSQYQTPSPVMSRKRSLSISDHQHTPQPAAKKRKYDPRSPPPWARRERDGHQFVLTPRSEPAINHNSVTPQPPPHSAGSQKQAIAPPPPMTPGQPSNAQLSGALGESRLEPSLDNKQPYDDVERRVCDFLFHNIILQDWKFNNNTKIEVEAKLGSIKDIHNPAVRWPLPISTPAVIGLHGMQTRFESSMNMDQHSRLNKYLNMVTQQSQRPDRTPIKYTHTRETDYFYDIPDAALSQFDPEVRKLQRKPPRLRVTRDNASDRITAVIIKTRIADLEVRCPSDEFDFRVSISLETNWTTPGWEQFPEHLDQLVRTTRNKDRLSYQHQGFLVDLTQVTPFSKQGEKVEKVHELEIEMDVERLVEEGYKNYNNQTNDFESLVHVFLNNVKVVNRAAKAPVQPGAPPLQMR